MSFFVRGPLSLALTTCFSNVSVTKQASSVPHRTSGKSAGTDEAPGPTAWSRLFDRNSGLVYSS